MELSEGLVSEFEKLKQDHEQRVTDEQLQEQAETQHDLMLLRHFAQVERAVAIAHAAPMHRLYTGVDDLLRQYYSDWVTIEEHDDRLVQARIVRLDHIARSVNNVELGVKYEDAGIDLRLVSPDGSFATDAEERVVGFGSSSRIGEYGVNIKRNGKLRGLVEFGSEDWEEIDQILNKIQTVISK